MHPSVRTRAAQLAGLLMSRAINRAHAFDQHETTDGGQHDEVREADQQIQLTDRAKLGEDPHPARRPDKPA